MMAKPMKTLELHDPVIQFLILTVAHDTTSVKLHYMALHWMPLDSYNQVNKTIQVYDFLHWISNLKVKNRWLYTIFSSHHWLVSHRHVSKGSWTQSYLFSLFLWHIGGVGWAKLVGICRGWAYMPMVRPNKPDTYIYFFPTEEGTVTNPAIWLVLSAVRIFLSLTTVTVTAGKIAGEIVMLS